MNRSRMTFSLGLDRYSGFYLWALAIVVFGVWKPHLFLTQATLHSVASSQAISAMLAIAVLVPLAAGAFDLSVGATINLSAIIVAWLQTTHHWNMWPAMIIAVVATFLVGVVNGFIVVKLRINSFIATLGMATVVAAVQIIVSGNSQPNPPTTAAWNSLTQRTVGGFQIVVLYLVVLAVFFWWLLEHTPAGRYIHATGGNQEAARLAGVKVDYWTWVTLIISATVSGIAGVLYSSLSGPSLTFGSTLLLPAFAAVFLGSTQLKPGRLNVWGTMLAVYVLATGVTGLELVTGVQWLNDMFNGVALIVAVGFAVWRQRRAAATRRVGAPHGVPQREPEDEAAEVAGSPAG
ncbi:MAG: ABC transporter permease [Acidimicrobiales bacterium]